MKINIFFLVLSFAPFLRAETPHQIQLAQKHISSDPTTEDPMKLLNEGKLIQFHLRGPDGESPELKVLENTSEARIIETAQTDMRDKTIPKLYASDPVKRASLIRNFTVNKNFIPIPLRGLELRPTEDKKNVDLILGFKERRVILGRMDTEKLKAKLKNGFDLDVPVQGIKDWYLHVVPHATIKLHYNPERKMIFASADGTCMVWWTGKSAKNYPFQARGIVGIMATPDWPLEATPIDYEAMK